MAALSVIINTLNEEANLPDCLESVRWCEDIVVVDMHSEDNTVAIAESFGCRVFQHDRTGYVEPARNFAVCKAQHEWVLVLDADERASSAMSEWSQALPAANCPDSKADAFLIPRRNYYGQT